MIRGVGLLLGFQLAGELIVSALRLPVSGPICGMAVLLAWLCWQGQVSDDLGKVTDGLLANMAILFVPVGAGAMVYADLFTSHWPALLVAIVLGTFATIATTAMTTRWLGLRGRLRDSNKAAPENSVSDPSPPTSRLGSPTCARGV